jgi:hypothetical protein
MLVLESLPTTVMLEDDERESWKKTKIKNTVKD